MYRRFLVSVALLTASVTATTWAQERATFIKNDGSRLSGAVVFHGGLRENIINGMLNLGNDAGGPEHTMPVNDVAVIDFAGGMPDDTEKNAVPTDSSQLLVLKNGETHRGHLVNLIGGDTLIWQPVQSTVKRYPIGEVRRVYLNGRTAWTAYIKQDPPVRARTSPPAVPAAPAVGDAGSVEVPSTIAWTDTGITVRRGERISFNATGSINLLADSPAGPDGRPGQRSRNYQVPTALGGALIGKIGNSRPFLIGSDSQVMTMPVAGRLFLGVNDDHYDDNSGSFTVKVNKQ